MIYLDNASTYHPKSEKIAAAIEAYMRETISSPGRGGHRQARKAADIILNTRMLACRLFNGEGPENFHFCANATYGLNFVIQGILKAGDHVVTTALEHNSVLRPLKKLSIEKNVEVEIVPSDSLGVIDPYLVIQAIRPSTRLVVLNHGSNVVGTVLDITPILEFCRKIGVFTLVDASQTAGILPMDLEEMPMDFMVTTGHKALSGPSGTGIIYARKTDAVLPILVGGTGGNSISVWHPQNSESIFEAGTPNYLGIAGLGAALSDLLETNSRQNLRRELELTKYMVESFQAMGDIQVYGPSDWKNRIPLVSFNIRDISPQVVTARLDDEYGIVVRGGLQCAPFAHHMLGTAPDGTVRASLSHATTHAEIDLFLLAVRSLCRDRKVLSRQAL